MPVECYASSKRGYKPRTIEPAGGAIHYFSCENVLPENPYDTDACWQLMHDLNFEPAERKYNIYTGDRSYASAHFMIPRDGSILQLVPLEFQAWHAGTSIWKGRKHCNCFMFGIELIGSYGVNFTAAQYKSLVALCRWLRDTYGIEDDMFTGHEHIAPGRKQDPGPSFDWSLFNFRMTEGVTV